MKKKKQRIVKKKNKVMYWIGAAITALLIISIGTLTMRLMPEEPAEEPELPPAPPMIKEPHLNIENVFFQKAGEATRQLGGYPEDMVKKVKKAKEIEGTRFLHVYAPCPTGWKCRPEDTIRLARMVIQNTLFPLYEIENGTYKINIKPREKKPINDYLKIQGRFRHLSEAEIAYLQGEVDKKWEKLLKQVNS